MEDGTENLRQYNNRLTQGFMEIYKDQREEMNEQTKTDHKVRLRMKVNTNS